MQSVRCHVTSVTSLTPFVYKVLLKPEMSVDFLPGQYLNLIMADDDRRPFSIASSPNADEIELQIGAYGEDSYAMQAIDFIKGHDSVTIELPLGRAYLRTDSERPLLLIAGGTGFSYIKSMFNYLRENQSTRPVIVYWGVRDPSACYQLAETSAEITSLRHGQFVPVVESADDNWTGKTGLVHQVVMADISDLSHYDIYLAGRFDMIAQVRQDFLSKGALLEHMYADAFAFI